MRAAGEASEPIGREALTELCQAYWAPVYAYLRRSGEDPDSARDLTQGFFALLLEKGAFRRADPGRGRFRSFLLASLKNYLANEHDRETARKRGGGQTFVELDVAAEDSGYRLDPAHEETPEKIFERRWAHALLVRVMARLRDERSAGGESARAAVLLGLLTGETAAVSYRNVADELGMTEAAVKAAVYRLRCRYGEILREEILETVDELSEVDAEIQFLQSVLGA